MATVFRDPRRSRSAGYPVWCLDYYDLEGRRRRERTNARTKEMAQQLLRKKLEELERAKLAGATPIREVTFDKFTSEYLDHVTAVRSASAAKRVPSHVRSLAKTFGPMVLCKVTRGAVQRWVDQRTASKKRGGKAVVKPATVVCEFVTLSAIFREAVKRGYAAANPCRGTSLPRVNNQLTRCLTDPQEEALLAACCDSLRPIVVTALYAGLRKGELLALQWGDVDVEHELLTVVHGKGEKRRHIPMVPEVIDALKAVTRHVSKDGAASPYVFNNPQTGTCWVDIKKMWTSALRAAGIRDFRFHDTRHTFASRLARLGVTLKVIQELLGHASLKMTMRYAHLAPGDLKKGIMALSKKAQEAKGKKKSPRAKG